MFWFTRMKRKEGNEAKVEGNTFSSLSAPPSPSSSAATVNLYDKLGGRGHCKGREEVAVDAAWHKFFLPDDIFSRRRRVS